MLSLNQRQKPLSIMLTLPLVLAHYVQSLLRAGDIVVLPLQVQDHGFLFSQPPLSLDDFALGPGY